MEYLLLIHADPEALKARSPAEITSAITAYSAYAESLEEAGIARGGKTDEQLTGHYLIDVPDLDTALAWAARCPGASHGGIEVRPNRTPEKNASLDGAFHALSGFHQLHSAALLRAACLRALR